MSNTWRLVVVVAILILIAFTYRYVVVDTRPRPQVQPTLDIQRPTQPIHELAPTPTSTPTATTQP